MVSPVFLKKEIFTAIPLFITPYLDLPRFLVNLFRIQYLCINNNGRGSLISVRLVVNCFQNSVPFVLTTTNSMGSETTQLL